MAHAKAVQLNGELCESIVDTLMAETRRHFGFLPRPLENKVDEVSLIATWQRCAWEGERPWLHLVELTP